jgi:hypothetical protein
MSEESKQSSVFADPETQALHERNLEWLRLMREDPGWALSRLHRLADIEASAEWEQEHGGCYCRSCNATLGSIQETPPVEWPDGDEVGHPTC